MNLFESRDKTGQIERPCRLLLVDDEEPLRKFIISLCRKSGIEVETVEASDGAEGFAKYRELMPDIVITDVCMPNMDGIELLKRIRQTSRYVDVIVVTGFADTKMVIEALRAGATNFVEKPFSVEDMREIIERSLGKWRIVNRASKLEGQLNRERSLRERTTGMATAGRLVAALSREISVPLTYLKGNAELVSELIARGSSCGTDCEDAKSLLADIGAGAERIADILNEIKKFQALSQGEREGVVELSALMGDTTGLARIRCPQNVEFKLVTLDRPIYLEIHPIEMESCFLNILLNAFENAGMGGGKVVFSASIAQEEENGGLVEVNIEWSSDRPGVESRFKSLEGNGNQGFWLWIANQAAERNRTFIDMTETEGGGQKATLRFQWT